MEESDCRVFLPCLRITTAALSVLLPRGPWAFISFLLDLKSYKTEFTQNNKLLTQ